MKSKKPKSKPPIPNDLEEFQALYGHDWLQIVRNPAFIAAAQLLNIRKLKGITNLSPEQIEKNGREILSNLVGHLQHEDDLFTLHDQHESKTPVEDEGQYLDPVQAVELEAKLEQFREQNRKARYGTGS